MLKKISSQLRVDTNQVICGDWLAVSAAPYDHTSQSGPHVSQPVGQSQDGHDLTGHSYIKLSLEKKVRCYILTTKHTK